MAIKKKAVGPNRAVHFLNSTVSGLTGRAQREGFLFGVELEIEGQGVLMEGIPSKNWHRKAEGSLRGESIEYVFQQPCNYEQSVERINNLFKTFKKHNVKLANSYRTSTHVHLNFLDKTMKQAINFFLLHTIFEEVLAAYCGETRLGNLFCISTRDNEGLVDLLNNAVHRHGTLMEFGEGVRYCAANLAALNQFGSIEIRTMRGADSAEEVLEWLEILNSLYQYSCSDACPAPWVMCEKLSSDGPEGFLRNVFGRVNAERLLNKWPPVRDFRQSLYDGMRLIMMFAYGLEEAWTAEYKKEVPKPTAPLGGHFDRFGNPVFLPVGELQNDRIELPEGRGQWYVHRIDNTLSGAGRGDRRITITDNIHARFDRDMQYWYCEESGEVLRWTIYHGNPIRRGTDNDALVNAWYEGE